MVAIKKNYVLSTEVPVTFGKITGYKMSLVDWFKILNLVLWLSKWD